MVPHPVDTKNLRSCTKHPAGLATADDSLYLPGVVHHMATILSAIAIVVICMASHGLFEIPYTFRWLLAIMLPAIVLGSTLSAFLIYRLPPPGTPRNFFF